MPWSPDVLHVSMSQDQNMLSLIFMTPGMLNPTFLWYTEKPILRNFSMLSPFIGLYNPTEFAARWRCLSENGGRRDGQIWWRWRARSAVILPRRAITGMLMYLHIIEESYYHTTLQVRANIPRVTRYGMSTSWKKCMFCQLWRRLVGKREEIFKGFRNIL